MGIILLIAIIVLAVNTTGISGTLKKIEEHNRRFVPEPRERLSAGDVIVAKAYGGEQAFGVTGVTEDSEGRIYATVEPLASSGPGPVGVPGADGSQSPPDS